MTILSHIYNEEFLLPWWLKHHRNFFDHGIIIDYASTDRSVEIVKELCPTWEVVKSKNPDFNCYLVDREVEEYERNIAGWRICLNTTEFLYGDYKNIDTQSEYQIPALYFVDQQNLNTNIDFNRPLHDQIFFGIDWKDHYFIRCSRLLHKNSFISYPTGRHYNNVAAATSNFVLFNYGQAPFTREFIKRKLQIQYTIPEAHRQGGSGREHYIFSPQTGWKFQDESDLIDKLDHFYRPKAKDLSETVKKYVELTYK